MGQTGEGAHMAFFDGVFVESTEELAGTWCGDLLQIVDELPEGFQLINCCFAEIWGKAKYYYRKFGTNEKGLIITNTEGKLYEAADLDFYFKRCPLTNVKVTIEKESNRIKYTTVKVEYVQGLAEGEAKGLAEGEHKKAVAVARQAIQMGLAVEDASQLSGLTVEQIQEVINSNY